jgi:hypothetical protein
VSTKKKEKTKSRRRDAATDWQPVFGAVKDVIDWALDIAVKLSRDLPEDIEAIEKVRVCFHAWLDGEPCEMDVNDLLITFASILSAIEVDLGIDSVELLAPLRAIVDAPSTLPRVLRFPSTPREDLLPVVIRRFPRRRNASGGLTQFAA